MNITKNREQQLDIVFNVIRDFVIKISQAKYGWLDTDTNREIVISIENKLPLKTLNVEFRNNVEISNLDFFVITDDGKHKKLLVQKIYENPQVIELDLDHINGVTHFGFSHTKGLWESWKYHNYVISAVSSNPPLKADEKEVLFDSMMLLQKAKDMVMTVFDNSAFEAQRKHLVTLIDSAMFLHDWVRPELENLEQFKDVELAISPYSVGAHGYTLPLASQGKDQIMSILPNIVNAITKLGVPWFCTSGTLLGFVRDRELIAYDDDLDFGVYLGEAHDVIQLRKLISNFRDNNKNVLTQGINNLHYRLTGFRAAIDIFVSWSDGDGKMWIYPWCASELSYADIFPTSQIAISDCEISMPNNFFKALDLNYGNGWRVPDPLWRFDWGRSNVLFSKFLREIKEL